MTTLEILNFLRSHKDEFRQKFGVTKLGLFGSYARGEATENSDIDIFVNMKQDIFLMVHFKEILEDELHQTVDLIANHKHIKPFLLNMINRDILYV
ncbi:putative nucleotidyltransferase [Thiovulum sp. ES]|nr:putative nucleotidyltransferase [Thiovulum sp. ES]